MKAITKRDIEMLRHVRYQPATHRISWRCQGPTMRDLRITYYDHRTVVTPRLRRLVDAAMVVRPEPRHHNDGGLVGVTALGARVLDAYVEHLAIHRDFDTALSRTTFDWQAGRL